jgi:hypothetical protein
MPLPSTMTPIATTTLTTNTSTITFSSIPQTYTDIVAVIVARVDKVSEDYFSMRLNGDTGSNYSFTHLSGNGSTIGSGRFLNLSQGIIGWTGANTSSVYSITTCNIMNYANATTYKTFITRSDAPNNVAYTEAGLWRSTSAISSISFASWGAGSFGSSNMITGTTITLYGIKAA